MARAQPLLLLNLLSLVALASSAVAPDAPQFSTPVDVESRDFLTVCPTDGRRAVRRDPSGDPTLAQIVTSNCAVVGDSIALTNGTTLDLSSQYLDLVLSYPDAETLNFAFNRLDFFPADATITAARTLILRGNKFRSLTDIDVPPELEYLDVRSCEITTLGTKTAYPQSLVKLRVGDNKLTTLRGMTYPPRLRVLEVDDQPLLSLEGAALPSTLEILLLSNTSLSGLNASTQLPESLVTIDLSANRLASFPDLYAFPSIADVNVSFNSISSITGIQFPWTLKRLDLRGNPLTELEITRSDLKLFQSWSYLLPPLTQASCRASEARKVRVGEVDLCVLEDSDFNRIYGVRGGEDEAGRIDNSSSTAPSPGRTSLPDITQPVQPATQNATSTRNPLTWAFLIIAITVIAIVVIGVISVISWKHQQLRRKVKIMMDRNTHLRTSSFNDDLLRAVGLEGELVATRFDSEEIKILHVLRKHGNSLVYLGVMRDDNADDASTATPRMLADEPSRSSALSIHDLDCSAAAALASGRQLVTLKRIVPELCTPKSATLRNFVQEIQLMAQLEHPKLISFVGVSWNTLADVTMVLEYLPNGDLRTLLRAETERRKLGHSQRLRWNESQASFASTLSLRAANVLPSKCSIALDVVEALVYLHSFAPPVLHRELRARHVLFSEHYEAKLSNVGAPGEQQLDVAKTAALDSVAWIAPEILRGDRYTTQADVYAFGILLTELATGAKPFDGLAPAAIVVQVAHEHARPSLGGGDCPDLVQHVARRCMSADASARPTADEVQRELLALRVLMGRV